MNRRRFFAAVFVPFTARYLPMVAPRMRQVRWPVDSGVTFQRYVTWGPGTGRALVDAQMLLERQAVLKAHSQGLAKFERLIKRYKSAE